jgi:hypothetical protein
LKFGSMKMLLFCNKILYNFLGRGDSIDASEHRNFIFQH